MKTKDELIYELQWAKNMLMSLAPKDTFPNERLVIGEIDNAIAMIKDADKDEWK